MVQLMMSMASIRFVLLVLLACFLFSSYIVGVVEGARRLVSKDEDVELESQLKLLNKPAIKSIQTMYGDIYDCIDFYKQPAFDHPLLKNHTFHPQMKPSSVPKLTRDKELSNDNFTNKMSYHGLGVACPRGTVPIKRVTKDDLIRERLYLKKYGSEYNVLNSENPGTHYAVVQTKFDPKKKYNGGGAMIAVFNPSVTSSQYSSSRVKIQNGPESIEVGWTVNPTLYGDNLTRQYIFFNGGQSRCFNTRCPGFVIVDSEVPIDLVLPISSKDKGDVQLISLLYRDQPVGNWWLEGGIENKKFGFWPARIFSNLGNAATSVQWGGEVFSPPNIPSPPMGTGDFPGSNYVAYCVYMTTIDEANKVVDVVNTEEYKDIDLYKSMDVGFKKGLWQGHAMFFGGPGKATGN